MTARRLASIAVVVAFVVSLPGIASAAWSVSGADVGKARAMTLPGGPTPTASATGRSVQVSWVSRAFADGTPVAGYRVTRYDPADAPSAATGGCAGIVVALTCTEAATPGGTWRYAVRAVHASWTGAEGGKSASVVVDPPSLAFTGTTTFTSLPANVSGSLAGFVGGESVTFRLNDPITGTAFAGSTTPTPVPLSGIASVSVTIPNGTADGTHQVFAVGSVGSVASASITVDRNVPTVTAATIAKSSGGIPGAIREGGSYHVYANVSDMSGVSVVTANVGAITTGVVALPLVAGSWSVGGTTYGYRSIATIANVSLSEGAKAFTVSAIDLLGNASSPSSYSVVVDNTVPKGADVQTANGGATVGKPETGDTVTFTFTEPMEPASFLTGWTGSAANVTVRIVDSSGSDELEIWNAANTARLAAFGSIRLASTSFVTSTVSFTGSSAVLTGNTLTVVLGVPNGATGTDTANTKLRWSTDAGASDVAGNPCYTGNVNEGGSNDPDF